MYKYFAISSGFKLCKTKTRPHLEIFLIFCKGKAPNDNFFGKPKRLFQKLTCIPTLHKER